MIKVKKDTPADSKHISKGFSRILAQVIHAPRMEAHSKAVVVP
jgi:hypothetical protein